MTGTLRDVDLNIRYSHHIKVILNQMLQGVVASEGLSFPSILAAAGDKITAAAFKELKLHHVATWLYKDTSRGENSPPVR
jgi:hypothetical protein